MYRSNTRTIIRRNVAAAAAYSPAHDIKRDVIIHRKHAVVDVLVQ